MKGVKIAISPCPLFQFFSKNRVPISIYQEYFPDTLVFNHLIITILSCQGIPLLSIFKILNFREYNIRFYSKHK